MSNNAMSVLFVVEYMVVLLLCTGVMVAAYWKIFVKAGEAGWKALVPFYGEYTLYQISWQPVFYFVFLVLSMVVSGFSVNATGGMVVVLALVGLVAAVINVIQKIKLGKAFGKGGGFILGLILLPPIFLLMLGYGSSKYIGKV